MGKEINLTSFKSRPVFISQVLDNSVLDYIISGRETSSTKPAENYKTTSMEQTFTWTYNIIKSCNNDFHFDCADVLISLFKIKYGESDMVLQLKQLRENKWVSIHGILV